MKIQLFATKFDDLTGENIGIGRISAYLTQSDQDITITYLDKTHSAGEEFEKVDVSYEMYGFSMYNNNVTFFISIINEIKKANPHSIIVLGSKFVTAYYRDIFEREEFGNVDFVILGDGEYAISGMIQCIENGEDVYEFAKTHPNIAIKGFVDDKVPAVLDINLLPYPDRTWLKKNQEVGAYICDCHGCVGKCTFCTFANYHHKWNGRSASDIFNEIVKVHNECKVKHFSFTGGSFEDPGELGKKKIEDLCNLLSGIEDKFSLKCFLRANTFKDNEKDKELLKLMRKAGFYIASVGVESGNEEDLKLFNKRASIEDNLLMLRLLNEADIYTGFFGFIMFNPYSNLEKLKANYQFLSKAGVHIIYKYISKVFIHKGTSLYNTIKQDGLLDSEGVFYNDSEIGMPYRFKDKDIEFLWEFVKNHFRTDKFMSINNDTEGILNIIYGFYDFLENGIELKNESSRILYKNELMLKEYFYNLYVNTDLEYCDKVYDEFVNNLWRNNQDLTLLKNRLVKQLTKKGIFRI